MTQLPVVVGGELQLNFDAIIKALPTLAEKGYLDSITAFITTLLDDPDAATARVTLGMTRGIATATFSASPTSAPVSVAHGLGVTPTAVLLTGVGGIAWPVCQLNSGDATNFSVTVHDADGTARTGTNQFCWLAVS